MNKITRLLADSNHTLFEQKAQDVLEAFFPDAFKAEGSLVGISWSDGDGDLE